jgi:predicted acetyltransferase
MTSTTSAFPISPRSPDEGYAFEHAMARAFGATLSDEAAARRASLNDRDATLAARDGGRIIGTTVYRDFAMSVPYAPPVSCAGVTGVAVLPTHRRRGVLTSLMRHQIDDLHDRGRAWAALYASEAGIYGRYGYGLASRALEYAIERPWTAFTGPPAPTTVEWLDVGQALDRLPAIYAAAHATVPGMMSRSDRLWRFELEWDPESERGGASERQLVAIADRAYALYRVTQHWSDTGFDSTLRVEECLATDVEAHRQMWAFLFGIDLVRHVEADQVPVDDPLPWWLVNRGRLRISEGEPCYVRLIDVGAALSQRGTRATGCVVLDVADPFCPWNARRWRLEGDAAALRCTPTDAGPDITLHARELASLSLGGVTAAELTRAGLIDEHTPGTRERLDALLASPRPPWNPFIF